MEISANTRLLALLGDPISHSLSPTMHNAACRALGLDAVYVALRVPAGALAGVVAAIAAVGGAGNVTVPHKEAVERALARKTDACARAGACNTFWTEDSAGGTLAGDNTDVAGVRAALRELGIDGLAGPWLLVGTGGSARAVAIAAAEENVELVIRSRDDARARAFALWATERGARARPATAAHLEVHVAINATPLGLRADDPLPIQPAAIPDVRAALDLVYAPGETHWVRALRTAGARARDGRGALVHQGAAAFVRFFPGTAAPVEVMRAAVERALRV